MTLNCIILNLVEAGRHEDCVKMAKVACLKDLVTSLGSAQLASVVFARNRESLENLIEEKEFYAIIRTLGTQHESLSFLTDYGNRGIATLIDQDQIEKVREFSFVNFYRGW